VLDAPELVEAQAKLRDAKAKETHRKEKLELALREAEDAPVTERSPTALQTATALAKPDETPIIERVAKRREKAFLAEQERRDKLIAPRLDQLAPKIIALANWTEKPNDVEPVEPLIRDVEKELNNLSADIPVLSTALQGQANLYISRLGAARKALSAYRVQAKLEVEITQRAAVGYGSGSRDASAYVSALEAFTRTLPSAPRSSEFKRVVADKSYWDTVFAWGALVESWSGAVTKIDPKTARERAAQSRQFLVDHPAFPGAADIIEYQKHLDAIARRDGADDSALAKLRRLLSDHLVEPVWMITTREDGVLKRYYLSYRPEIGARQIKYIIDFDKDSEQVKTLGNAIAGLHVIDSSLSPQSNVAKSAKSVLARDEDLKDWESVTVQIARQFQQDAKIDPLLNLALLQRVMTYAAEGSELLSKALAPQQAAIEQANLKFNKVAWMDPEDAIANRLRPRAEEVVLNLSAWDRVLQTTENARRELEQRLTRLPIPVGWLAKDDAIWRCRTAKGLNPHGDLWVILPDRAKGSVWSQIGSITARGPTITVDSPEVLIEGRLVFAGSR
jgi:hypothetical protein